MTDILQAARSCKLMDERGNPIWRLGVNKPDNKPCPKCSHEMHALTPYIPDDWPGADEYDHYWCDKCCDAYDFDEVKP